MMANPTATVAVGLWNHELCTSLIAKSAEREGMVRRL